MILKQSIHKKNITFKLLFMSDIMRTSSFQRIPSRSFYRSSTVLKPWQRQGFGGSGPFQWAGIKRISCDVAGRQRQRVVYLLSRAAGVSTQYRTHTSEQYTHTDTHRYSPQDSHRTLTLNDLIKLVSTRRGENCCENYASATPLRVRMSYAAS